MSAKYLQTEITENIESARKRMAMLDEAMRFVADNEDKFNDLPTAVIFINDKVHIDFNLPSHSQTMQIVMAFSMGRWQRTPNEDKIDYTCNITEHVVLRCWKGEPPPNCRIVYEEVEVPAQPARIERRAKIMCQPVNKALPEPQTALIEA